MLNYINRVLILLSFPFIASAQSDGCTTATPISVTANCSTPTVGSTLSATQTIPGCAGTADDDVWYSFVATSTSHQIVITPDGGFDPVVQLFSGGCGSLVSLVCKDNFLTGETETINYSGLSVGVTYYIRVYHYYAGPGSGNFTICVTNPPPAPSNDLCSNPLSLTVNTVCTYTSGTTSGATQSYVGCAGTADDDVWYSFVATNASQTITVHPTDGFMDPVVQLYSGSCGSLSSINCMDQTFTGEDEVINAVGLIPGNTYRIRVYDYYNGDEGDFDICVVGPATPAPTNDEPCNAIQIPDVTSACNYLEFSTVGATASLGAPAPSSCGGSSPYQGGFSASSLDVWFSIVVPSSGNISITSKPNMGAGRITDGVMALYSGTCGSLSQIACNDDNSTYPGTGNDLLPFLNATGLTPGSTVYLRYWGYGTSSGAFGICVSTALNDDCINALYICDINGYSASTSVVFTEDRPDNMHGNNEGPNGESYPNGTNTGGIFGQGGPWGTGSSAYDVEINNNSWIKFTASLTTATLYVDVYDCFTNNGIQMQIFEGNNCSSFVPVSNFEESATGFVITANGLTVGNDYYLMVDGFAGDVCSYTITAQSGVQFPDIPDVSAICQGESVLLTAPPGANSYDWQHDGSSTQSVNVTPGTTITYYCEVTGLCDYKQMLDVTVDVKPIPNVSITQGSAVAICNGQSTTLNATGATTYIWSTSATGSSIVVNPSSNTSYTVTGTTNGCSAMDAINVTVNSLPNLSVAPSATAASCGMSDGSLTGTVITGNGPFTYQWYNSSLVLVGSSADLNSVPAGSYTLVVSDGNTCGATFGPFSIASSSAPSNPIITVDDDATPCLNGSFQLTASGDVGSTFSWSGPSFTSGNATINLNNVTLTNSGNYCVVATIAGCTSGQTCQAITVQPLPTINVAVAGNDSTICDQGAISMTASGGTSYSWTGPNSFSNATSGFTISPASAVNDGYYVATGTDANGCQAQDSMLITMLALPSIGVTADNGTGIYCENEIAILTASGASSYNWSGPNSFTSNNTVVTLTNVSTTQTGAYTVTGTDANGCINDAMVNLTINARPTLSVIPASSPAGCGMTDGSITGATASGTPTITYEWFDSGANSVGSTSDLTGVGIGDYTLVVTDGNSCTQSFGPYNVSNPSNPATPTIVIDDATPCLDGSVQMEATSPAGATFSWSGPNSFTASTTIINLSNITVAEEGNYCVVATITGCNSAPACQAIVVNSLPNIQASIAGNDSTICDGGIIDMNATGGASYSWTGPNGFTDSNPNFTIDPASSLNQGYYVLNGTDGNGCSGVDSMEVTILALPTISVIADNGTGQYCEGTNATLTVSGTTNYSWTGPNSFSSNSDVVNLSGLTSTEAGWYYVSGTDAASCSTLDSIEVMVNLLPTLSTAPTVNSASCGSTDGSIIDAVISGSPTLTYEWFDAGLNSMGTNVDLINVGIGDYTLIVTDGNLCTNSFGPYTVSNPSNPTAPTIDPYDDTPCTNGNVTLTAYSDAGATFSWTGPNSFSAATNAITISNLTSVESGNYCVTATVTGCQSQSCFPVSVLALPTITPSIANGDQTICDGGIIDMSASGAVSYSWSGPNGFTDNNQGFIIDPASAVYSGTFTVTGTDADGCIGTNSMDVTIVALPTISISADHADNLYCDGTTATLTANGGVSYSWSGPNGFASASNPATVMAFDMNSVGTYIVVATDAENCVNNASIDLGLGGNIPIVAAASDSIVCPGEAVTFTANGGVTYVWNGPGLSTNDQSFTFSNTSSSNTGWYYVDGADANGCTGSDSTYISVEPNSDCLFIPELTTPDGDGHNDTWEITGVENFKNSEVEIYNRWGSLIYKVSPYLNDWGGEVNRGATIDGEGKVPVGTYFYILRLNDEKDSIYKGYVEVQY